MDGIVFSPVPNDGCRIAGVANPVAKERPRQVDEGFSVPSLKNSSRLCAGRTALGELALGIAAAMCRAGMGSRGVGC